MLNNDHAPTELPWHFTLTPATTEIKVHLLLCLGADFDCAYIPHLCRHYASAVDSWIVVLHSNDCGSGGESIIAEAKRIFAASLEPAGATGRLDTCSWQGVFNSAEKVTRLNERVRERVLPGEWIVYVDADEFIDAPHELRSLAEECTARQQKVVYGRMVDRFADDRQPQALGDADDLFALFPHRDDYTRTELRASTHKPCLMQYDGNPPLESCHDHAGYPWSDYLRSGKPLPTIWHFKWIESTRQKLLDRVRSFKDQRLGWWRESAVSLEQIYGESPPHSWRPLRLGVVEARDGGQLLIRLPEAACVQLNPTAAMIWERCDGRRTVAGILAELCGLFDAPINVLRRDLHTALDGLLAAGALAPRQEHDANQGGSPKSSPNAGLGRVPGSNAPLRLRLGLVSETSVAFLNQVKLCLFSLRRNGGALRDIPVTLITNGGSLGAQETRFFERHFAPIDFRTSPRLGAIPHTSKLNVFYSIDPSTYDVLLYLDCDTVVRQSLDRMIDPFLTGDAQFVCRRGGETDRNRFVDFDALVRRFCGPGRQEKIVYQGSEEWPMFNSGVFLATSEAVLRIRREAVDLTYRLFNEWQRASALEQLPEAIRNQLAINQIVRENWTIEQGALALACIKAGVKVQYLHETYNTWGGETDFHVLHCFKSLYRFNRRTMFSAEAEPWISEYLASDIPGKVFLAGMLSEYRQAFDAGDAS